MKRRKKKSTENETEATGKVGQQKPPVDDLHPEPLVPTYDDVDRGTELDSAHAAHEADEADEAQPHNVDEADEEAEAAEDAAEAVQAAALPDEPRIVTEVQPESTSTPPPGIGDWLARVREDNMVQAPRCDSAFKRPAAHHPF